jgi:K+-transporting ATPase ATPase C chain
MLASLPSELLRGLRLTLVIAVVTGLVYPLVITGVAQLVFHDRANGSLVSSGGQVVGSKLIGQQFTGAQYFHGRVSTTNNASDATKPEPYNAQNSGSTNLAPSNQALSDRVSGSVSQVQKTEYGADGKPVPVDLVTTSFSGLDPDVTEASALLQVGRVAGVRGLDSARVRALVQRHLQSRVLGVFGEPHVNVLELNMALDRGEAG